MPRAKRYHLPGYVWHPTSLFKLRRTSIIHRCHKRDFLLKFARDRRRWIEWLYQAKKRYRDLSVLDYMVTSNHIHLLVSDSDGRNVIPNSIKLIACRIGQEFNTRKSRKGAFWEDLYHATAVDSNRYLRQCITYIDLNMVRAGVVAHPAEWEFCGYNEIQSPRKRKGIIDFNRLQELLGFYTYSDLKAAHFIWVESRLQSYPQKTESKWIKSIAVGSKMFNEKIKEAPGVRVKGRNITCADDTFELREGQEPYGDVVRGDP